MARTVADDLWNMLIDAGVRRCYGIVGDALNPTIAALSKRDEIEFVHVRHEEWGAFAASADARLSGGPVAVCGTAGPGVTHLLNGLLDAKHERSSVIAIAGDVETSIIDTAAVEEISPYDLFRPASLYTGRAVNPTQARAVFEQAVTISLQQHGPTVIALPGDVASADSPLDEPLSYTRPAESTVVPADSDVDAVAQLINGARKVLIFGGEGCRDAADAVAALSDRIKAPVGYSLKGKNWLETITPNAVGMTGLLGYGACHHCITEAEVILMLGTDFPFPGFLDRGNATIVQVDVDPSHLGRRVAVAQAVHADVGAFVDKLTPRVTQKSDDDFLAKATKITARWRKRLRHYVDDGETRSPIRPEYLAALLDEQLDDDAIVTVDTGTAVIWVAHQMTFGGQRQQIGSYSWASMADASPYAFGATKALPGRQVVAMCGDGGFSMLGISDLLTEVAHRSPVVHVVLNNSQLDFVNIEQQEAGLAPWGTDIPSTDYAAIATAMGAKGIRAEDPARLRDQVAEALAHRGGPVVLDVLVDKYALAIPSSLSPEMAKDFTLSVFTRITHGELGEVVHEGLDNVKLL
ncbi:pyruvate dehydrogenase [Gordonia jinhuaensis]|uniref:Pyruvate dehydrogenase n=1 Tax=Gordonia jinhuaensis TaxID=1517702 RepID=A0A916WXC5_9ACTN|nr:thiamine pyrophosphate-dependent enzyme [Gordonia jinhuaensis]GGB37276.1 pyruvate dehydrogenase [Gordonia jinhuaensis]